MEILLEILGFVVIEFIFSAIGWICLLTWYRDRKKIKKIRDEEYAGEYGAAGRVFILNLIAGVGAITMFGLVILVIVVAIGRTIAK